MTLTEIAKHLNTSTMTIYRRLDKAGIKISDLRDADTGGITPEGVSVIGSLFDATGQQAAQQTDTTRTQPAAQPDAQPIEVEAAVLRERVRGLEDKLQAAYDERDRLRAQVDTLTEMLRVEQQGRVKLLGDGGQQQKRGLFGLFRGRG